MKARFIGINTVFGLYRKIARSSLPGISVYTLLFPIVLTISLLGQRKADYKSGVTEMN